jgi:hypothetical protein
MKTNSSSRSQPVSAPKSAVGEASPSAALVDRLRAIRRRDPGSGKSVPLEIAQEAAAELERLGAHSAALRERWRWELGPLGTLDVYPVGRAPGAEVIAHVWNNPANAHLIAAAPELYESLEHLLDLFCSLRPLGDNTDREMAVLDARAALANATGGSQ